MDWGGGWEAKSSCLQWSLRDNMMLTPPHLPPCTILSPKLGMHFSESSMPPSSSSLWQNMHRVTYYGLFIVERMNEWWLPNFLDHLEIESVAFLCQFSSKSFNLRATTWWGRACRALNPLLMVQHPRNKPHHSQWEVWAPADGMQTGETIHYQLYSE